jgi:hypothetical protein
MEEKLGVLDIQLVAEAHPCAIAQSTHLQSSSPIQESNSSPFYLLPSYSPNTVNQDLQTHGQQTHTRTRLERDSSSPLCATQNRRRTALSLYLNAGVILAQSLT